MENIIKAKIYRYNPDGDKEPYFQDHEVPTDRRVTVHELLNTIHRDIYGTPAFRTYKCYKGRCSLCFVKLNGKVGKSCSTPQSWRRDNN